MLNRISEKLFKKKIRIRIAIFTTVSIFLMITVLTISVMFYYTSTSAIMKMADNTVETITKRVISDTTAYIQNPAGNLKIIAGSIGKGDIIAEHQKIWSIMWENVINTPQVISIYIGDSGGNFIQSRKSPEYATRIVNRRNARPYEKWFYRDKNFSIEKTEEKKQVYDPRERPWYKNTGVIEKYYMTDVYIFYTSKSPGITATYPVISPDGKIRAVVAADILLDQLSRFIVEQKVSDNGIVFIMDENDRLIAYPNIDRIIRTDEKTGELKLASASDLGEPCISDAVKKYRASGMRQFEFRTSGKNYISSFTPFKESFGKKWEIGVIIPEKDLTGSVRKMILLSVLISLLILLVALFFLNIITNRLASPILHLAEQTEHVKDFDLDDVTGVDSRYKEVDIMNNSIMAMKEGLLAFKKYVPSDLVKQLIKTGEGARLGGKKAELALMFTDIEKFTTISENMPIENLMRHLSEYLSELSSIIIDSQGTIDKYIGDAIMAFWGAPEQIENPSLQACYAALGCAARLKELNSKWLGEGKPVLNTRIGIHTGDVIIGNIGSEERLNYSVIGDSVNLASRLEGTNKDYNTDILISEKTYEYVKDHFYCRVIDKVAVVGKSNGVVIYQLLGLKSSGDIAMKEKCELYEAAFRMYQAGDFRGAYSLFRKSWEQDRDRTSFVLANRCAVLAKEGVPENWDGIWVMTHK